MPQNVLCARCVHELAFLASDLSPNIECGAWRKGSVDSYFEVKDTIGRHLAQHKLGHTGYVNT